MDSTRHTWPEDLVEAGLMLVVWSLVPRRTSESPPYLQTLSSSLLATGSVLSGLCRIFQSCTPPSGCRCHQKLKHYPLTDIHRSRSPTAGRSSGSSLLALLHGKGWGQQMKDFVLFSPSSGPHTPTLQTLLNFTFSFVFLRKDREKAPKPLV